MRAVGFQRITFCVFYPLLQRPRWNVNRASLPQNG